MNSKILLGDGTEYRGDMLWRPAKREGKKTRWRPVRDFPTHPEFTDKVAEGVVFAFVGDKDKGMNRWELPSNCFSDRKDCKVKCDKLNGANK